MSAPSRSTHLLQISPSPSAPFPFNGKCVGTLRRRFAMAWIKTAPEQDASGRVKEVYDSMRRDMPAVPNIMQSLSLKPEVLNAVAKVFTTGTFGSSSLSRVQEEMIATVV